MLLIVRIPGHIEPMERGERFEDPLHEALEKARLGEVTGGGSQLSEEDDQGRRHIEFCEIEIDLTEISGGLRLVKEELTRLQVPAGSCLFYEFNGEQVEEPLTDPQ